MPDKFYGLSLEKDGKMARIPLDGVWDYKIMKSQPKLQETTFFICKPSALYLGMLCPLRKLQFVGVLFYQGESNAGRSWIYQEEFAAMVDDWRA